MKRAASVLVVLIAVAIALPTMAAQKETLTGEVIDSVCYIKMGAKGAGHRECTQQCADAGIPLALLTADDQVVMLASSQSMTSPNAELKAHASHTVNVTGEWAERGGAKIFVIDSIEHVSS